jgi:hypothetical protein
MVRHVLGLSLVSVRIAAHSQRVVFPRNITARTITALLHLSCLVTSVVTPVLIHRIAFSSLGKPELFNGDNKPPEQLAPEMPRPHALDLESLRSERQNVSAGTLSGSGEEH